MKKFKGTSAKEFLLANSPNEKYGLRAELQKHKLRGVVETEMEAYAKLRLKESKTDEMLELLLEAMSILGKVGEFRIAARIDKLTREAIEL